jgi:Capsular polysaccharide synthesis protein
MASPPQLPAATTGVPSTTKRTTTTTTTRRTILSSTPLPLTTTAARRIITSEVLPSSSSSSSSWKRFKLHFVLLTSLLGMAVWHSIIQSGGASLTSTAVIHSSAEIKVEIVDHEDHGDTRGGRNSQASQPAGRPQKPPDATQASSSVLEEAPINEAITTTIAATSTTSDRPGDNNNNETTTSASQFNALELSIARGTAQVRHPIVNDTTTTNIPRIIWMFWDTGWPAKNHPGANMNRRSWELANPSFTVHALDGPTAERFTNRSLHVPDEHWQKLHVQAKSDVYRTLLLYQYGGIWADCNVFCNRPISQDWVDLKNAADVISFRRIDNLSEQVKKNIQPWITSWFLAAPPASYTMTQVMRVISNPNEHYRFRAQYFWWHHIVAQIANADPRVKDVIASYNPPGTCSGPEWTRQATVLKRCANKIMPPIIYTTEQCCPDIGGRPHIILNSDTTASQGNATMTTDSVPQQQQQELIKDLCSQWNCTVQAENLRLGNAIRKVWGMDRIRTLNADFFDP